MQWKCGFNPRRKVGHWSAPVVIEFNDLMEISLPLGKEPDTYVCMNPECKAISWDFEMKEITEPHGEVTLACPVCGSGEIE